LRLRQALIAWALPLLAATLLAPAPRAQPRLGTLLTNGPTSQLLNLVILAEAFTPSEETDFHDRARALSERFLSTAPYRDYRSYFNVFTIFVPSAESGADHPSRGVYRDTYFSSTYESYGLDRLLTIPPNDRNSRYSDGAGRVNQLLQDFLPEYDIALLLVNDPEYGGSGGFPAVASINESSAEVALHEIGHSFAGLGDEYDTPYPGFPDIEEPNTTRETRRAFIKWRDWILTSTPIPTPELFSFEAQVGLFEGAHFHATGWYRPKFNCKMNGLGVDFCEVCSEALVLAVYARLDLILGHEPAESSVTLPPSGVVALRAETLAPVAAPLSFLWKIDGAASPISASNTFPASAETLSQGLRTVTLEVRDPTLRVRTDPRGALVETRSWTVTVPAGPPRIQARLPQLTAQGLVLEFTATAPLDLVLEATADFQQWTPLRTNLNTATLTHTLPDFAATPPQFFRARQQ